MSVTGVNWGSTVPAEVSPVGMPAPAGRRGHAPFADVVGDFLRDANGQQVQAQQQVQGLMTGNTEHLHGVVLSVAQADLAFRLVLEIRNRLISSYQDLMRMQV